LWNYATIKYNSAGEQQWVARYNGIGEYYVSAIALDSSGNVYVTGSIANSDGRWDYATIKYNSAGRQQWVARYDGSGNADYARAIAVDTLGNVYVTGTVSDLGFVTIKYVQESQLGNISTRSFAQTGDNVVIGGFIVQGAQTKKVIIRAIGPGLTQYGVPNAMANPALDLHDGTEL
jgi:hypothetical protein